MRMPESMLVQRVWQRLSPLVRLEKPSGLKLKKLLGKSTVEVDLPDRWDSMQHDGIEEKPPAGMGEKAWWLLQMTRAIPPERWESHLQLSPEKCLAAFAGSEFKSSLLPGISGAALRHKNACWARSLVEMAAARISEGGSAPAAWDEWSMFLPLVAVLDESDRDSIIIKHLDQRGQVADAALGLKLLQSCPGSWTPAAARSLLNLFRFITGKMAAGAFPPLWSGLGDLTVLAGRIPLSIADEAQQSWPDDAVGKPFFKPMQTIIDILQFRSKMLKEIT